MKQIELTYNELNQLNQAIDTVNGITLDLDVMLSLGDLKLDIKPQIEKRQEVEKTILNKYSFKDQEDDNKLKVKNENLLSYQEAIRELGNKKVKVNIPEFKTEDFKDHKKELPTGFVTRMVMYGLWVREKEDKDSKKDK